MSTTFSDEKVVTLARSIRIFSTRMALFQQNVDHSLGIYHKDLKWADIINETAIQGFLKGNITPHLKIGGYFLKEIIG